MYFLGQETEAAPLAHTHDSKSTEYKAMRKGRRHKASVNWQQLSSQIAAPAPRQINGQAMGPRRWPQKPASARLKDHHRQAGSRYARSATRRRRRSRLLSKTLGEGSQAETDRAQMPSPKSPWRRCGGGAARPARTPKTHSNGHRLPPLEPNISSALHLTVDITLFAGKATASKSAVSCHPP